MYFSGIREAYDYQTTEGWWLIDVTFPEDNFLEWLQDFPYDVCSSEFNENYQIDWQLTILIKDPAAYLHLKSTWATEREYSVWRSSGTELRHEEQPARFHFYALEPTYWGSEDWVDSEIRTSI